jgi:N-acetylglucosaminyldiphosphoundecaprenol N-acetyl-beta-D-mannosaminyltransferase
LFGLRFLTARPEAVIGTLLDIAARSQGCAYAVTCNVDHVASLQRDPGFECAYREADVIVADGVPLVAYARLRGCALRRTTGHDLLSSLIRKAASGSERLFFVVNSEATGLGVVRACVNNGIEEERVQTVVPPHGFELSPDYLGFLVSTIRAHAADAVVFGVGAPKSEKVIHQMRHQLGRCIALPVGDAVSVFGQTSRRAPVWMQRSGIEWLYRVSRDPRRLAKRYMWDSRWFLKAVLKDLSNRTVREPD